MQRSIILFSKMWIALCPWKHRGIIRKVEVGVSEVLRKKGKQIFTKSPQKESLKEMPYCCEDDIETVQQL